MRITLALVLVSFPLQARQVTLTWNPQTDAAFFDVWDTAFPAPVARVATNEAAITISDMGTSVYVTAINAYGNASLPSDVLVINNDPLPAYLGLSLAVQDNTGGWVEKFSAAHVYPISGMTSCFFRYRKMPTASGWQLELQESSDLVNWTNTASFALPAGDEELEFQLNLVPHPAQVVIPSARLGRAIRPISTLIKPTVLTLPPPP